MNKKIISCLDGRVAIFAESENKVSNAGILSAGFKLTPYKKNVEASHYSDKLNGRRTASGQVFSNKKYTAAHKILKFGTKVKVTNLANKKSVVVTINDRGPHTRKREIDMAKRPFLDISHNNGRSPLRVSLEIVE